MRKSRRLIVFFLLFFLGTSNYVHTAVYYAFNGESSASITAPDVYLEQGTAGTSVVYPNATSAASQVDSHATTFYPNDYNITNGLYVSGWAISITHISSAESWSAAGASSHNLQYNLQSGAGNNRLVVVGVTWEDAQASASASVTFDSVAMTEVANVTVDTGSSAFIGMWYMNESLLPATTGNKWVNVTVSEAITQEIYVTVAEYTGVAQEAPDDFATDSNTSAGNTAVTLTAADNSSIVVAVGAQGGTNSWANTNNLVNIQDQILTSSGGALGHHENASSGDITVGWNSLGTLEGMVGAVWSEATTPGSVNQIDSKYFTVNSTGSDTSESQYYPTYYSLIENTTLTSGSLENLTSADGTDMIFQSYSWNDTQADYVDLNTSNVDSNQSIGKFSNFTAQQYGPDNVLDMLVEEAVNWWNSDHNYRKQINVTTGVNTPYKDYTGYTVQITLNTATLITAGKMQPNGNDLRIVYRASQSRYRKNITFSGIVGTHLSFPALIKTQNDMELAAKSQDGHEIYFTSDAEGVNKLKYERIQYSEDAQGADFECWVKIPSLSSGTKIYMWYGETTLSDQENPTEVWSNGYEAVWHLDETGTGNRLDSTANNRHAAPENYDSGDDSQGISSGAYHFTETGTDRLVSSNFAPGTSATTIEAWVFHEESDDDRIIAKSSSGTPSDSSYIYSLGVSGTTLRVRLHAGGAGTSHDATTSVPLNTWTHTAFTYDDTDDTIRFYVNGSAAGTASKSGSIDVYNNVVVIGDNDDGLNDRLWTGQLDEVRVSNVSRSSNWISSQVNNMVSPGAAGTETKITYVKNNKIAENQTIDINPSNYRNSTGWWKIKITGDKETLDVFNVNIDYITYITNYTSQYTAQTEYIFSNITDNQSPNLNFTVVSHNSIDGATVTLQVYNYTSSSFPSSGMGYLSYTSTGANNTRWVNVTNNAQSCLSGSYARIRVTSVYSTTDYYQQLTNFVRLLQEESILVNDYALRVTNNGTDLYTVRLVRVSDSNIDRIINCTIYFRSGETQLQVIDGAFTLTTGIWANLPAASSLDILIDTSTVHLQYASVIETELEVLRSGTTTYTMFPIQFTIT